MAVVDDQLAAARARPPVDRAQPVAGDEGARIGELETVRPESRDEIAGRELGLERRDEALQQLGPRIDVQPVRAADPALPDEHPDPAARAKEDVAELDRAPAVAAELSGSTRSSPATSRTPHGIVALVHRQPVRQHEVRAPGGRRPRPR